MARKKAAPKTNPLFDAFEEYAINLAAFHEARDAAFAAQQALKGSADKLASFGIYVSTTPKERTTEPAPGGADAPAPEMHAPAQTVERTPSATEVASIRSEAYGSEQEDEDALADNAADTMGKLMGRLGGVPSSAPQMVGHPMNVPPESPDEPNRSRGPVEQRPVKE